MEIDDPKKPSASDIVYSVFGGIFGAIIFGGALEVFGLEKHLYLYSFLFGLSIFIVIMRSSYINKY